MVQFSWGVFVVIPFSLCPRGVREEGGSSSETIRFAKLLSVAAQTVSQAPCLGGKFFISVRKVATHREENEGRGGGVQVKQLNVGCGEGVGAQTVF